MSGKLDQSLDAIMTESGGKAGVRGGSRRGPPRRAAVKAKVTPAAPTGGVQKSTRPPRNAPTAPAVVPPGDSKIIVSNLPFDISETQLKDFFTKAVGAVKKVLLSYGPNGRSRGEATVIFSKSTKAAEAQKQFNGVKVDDKAMRVEIVGGSAASVAQAKTLADRMAKPKNAARENTKAAVAKTVAAKTGAAKPAANGAPAGRREKKTSGRAGKPKAKTADELDAEMADYFGGTAPNGEATNGSAQPAATNGGEVAMQTDGDEVL